MQQSFGPENGRHSAMPFRAFLNPEINLLEEISPGLPRCFHSSKSAGVRFALAECAPIDLKKITFLAELAGVEFEIVSAVKVPYLEVRTTLPPDSSREQRGYEEIMGRLAGAINEIFPYIRGDNLPNWPMSELVKWEDLLPHGFNIKGDIETRPRVYNFAHAFGVRFETNIDKGDTRANDFIEFAERFQVTATLGEGRTGAYWHFQVTDLVDEVSNSIVRLIPMRGLLNLVQLYWESYRDGIWPLNLSNLPR